MAINEEEVEKFLRVVEEGKEAKASTKLFKALKKASGAVSVAIEFSRHPNADDGALHGVEFRQFSLKMRREKAGAIFVNADSKSGLQDCEKFVEEQLSAKGSFPGPLPVVRTGEVTSSRQVAEAKAAGVEGVLVPMSSASLEEVKKACSALGIEVLTLVRSKEECESAVASGSKIICVEAATVEEATAIRELIPKDCAAVACLNSRMSGAPEDVFSALKDENAEIEMLKFASALKPAFNAIIAQKAVLSVTHRGETFFGSWLLESLLSKKSGMGPVEAIGFTTTGVDKYGADLGQYQGLQ
ncbi:hypothetical protein GUITHDRAFT_137633 [Guillardia theta CCMP2712]|uniref:indole-3-glycerol-phosphate synthase n=1 Tax=Guillardia theta (strain CCMP2712) TaxID=905079 RepID=L1JGN0_GUITC|nr:hypothetical protein GUITHDRAFT_137633 [Guillardia theta CCMP2712]EKX47482.1 hypothetical protein GUITHDRAFT_137633 [Guillardia theta CCMP2712]|eukprot:XP_005834462.1 hypothetical protein GUITHDRAFT_137633 [Guillardia theta CCMP2712]